MLPPLSLGVGAPLAALTRTVGVPQGYVQLFVLDVDSNLIGQQVQPRQLSAAANSGYKSLTVRVMVGWDECVMTYVGNESDADMHFDEVQVVLVQDPWVQKNSKPKLRGS